MNFIFLQKISDELIEKVRETAKKAYHLFGCAGLTRVDFFVTEDGRVLLNELNTLPGFTSISMYPKLMANCGKEGKQLIAELIDLALNKKIWLKSVATKRANTVRPYF